VWSLLQHAANEADAQAGQVFKSGQAPASLALVAPPAPLGGVAQPIPKSTPQVPLAVQHGVPDVAAGQ
jgi:hypothetical protein